MFVRQGCDEKTGGYDTVEFISMMILLNNAVSCIKLLVFILRRYRLCGNEYTRRESAPALVTLS